MPNHNHIYKNEADRYELMISREDYEGNILKAIQSCVPRLESLDVVDLGAGTGRLGCLLAPFVNSITATDASQEMLNVAAEKLRRIGATHWKTIRADHRSLPLPDQSADLVTAGWTICYLTNTEVVEWKKNLALIVAEIRRILRPSGTVAIFENCGIGCETPHPPDYLKGYFRELEDVCGFSRETIRTDFRFLSFAEAEELTRFFFEPQIVDQVISLRSRIVPSCTGVWRKQFDC